MLSKRKIRFGSGAGLSLQSTKLSHHHLLELVKVEGAASVLVHLLNDVVQVALRQGAVDLAQDLFQDLQQHNVDMRVVAAFGT